MSVRRLPAPWGALAALGLLALVGALGWLGAVKPHADRRAALQQRAEAAEAQAQRFAAVLAAGPSAAPSRAPGWAAFEASDPMLAAAALQRRLDEAVAAAGGVRRSAQIAEPRKTDGVARVAVTIDAEFEAPALRDFLVAVETGRPVMIVERIEAQRIDGSLAEPADSGAVSVRATIAAFAPSAAGDGR
jgi:hypothetical protein